VPYPNYTEDCKNHGYSLIKTIEIHVTTTPIELLFHFRTLFKLCRDHHIRLPPSKSLLFAPSARWCGRFISGAGVRLDTHRVQGLTDMPFPETEADLQQFACALQWMLTATPTFTQIMAPLHSLLE
jgi:hypothetical protein